MGDIRIDQWYWKMVEHKRKGHHILQYPDMDAKKSWVDIKRDLFLKDQRASFWEKHHSIPTSNDLIWQEQEAEA